MFLLMALSWVPYLFSEIGSSGRTTTSNVEGNVRSWIDTFHLGLQRLPDDQTEYFMFAVTTNNGRRIVIHRNRDRVLERYLQFQAIVTVSDADQRRLQKLKPQEVDFIARDLRIELQRAKIGYSAIVAPITTFSVVKSVPIELLTEAIFAQTLNEMELGEALAIDTFGKELDSHPSNP
jgi:hypothetical protein